MLRAHPALCPLSGPFPQVCVCVIGEGLISRVQNQRCRMGGAALTNCLCAHLGAGLFWVNAFSPHL